MCVHSEHWIISEQYYIYLGMDLREFFEFQSIYMLAETIKIL